MNRRFWAHARRFVLGFAMLGSACSLAEGLNRLQEVDCVGLCPPDASEAAAADGGLDAASMPDATTGPVDAPASDGGDAVSPFGDGGSPGSDGSADANDGGDGGLSLLYIGCFADSMTRDLPVFAYDDPNDTPELCIMTCLQGGFAFAGLQNATQCYCGNAFGGQGPSDGCTEACRGDPTIICGGGYTNSVYATSPASVPLPPRYIGCFRDGTPQDLPYGPYSSDFNTTAACVAACTYHGYLYAGTQFSSLCFCGDSYGAYGTSLGCIDQCSGDVSETCGGSSANSVYRTSVADAGADAGNADGG